MPTDKKTGRVGDMAKPAEVAARTAYLGPNIPHGGLLNATAFVGAPPPHVQAHIAACPHMQALIVPAQDVPAAAVSIRTPGAFLNLAYEAAVEYARNRGKDRE